MPATMVGSRRSAASASDSFGLRHVLRTLERRRWVVFIVAATVTLGAVGFVLTRPPTYVATALLLMSPHAPVGVSADTGSGERPPQADSGYVQSQVEILNSAALSQRLVEVLGLSKLPNYSGKAKGERGVWTATEAVSRSIDAGRRAGTYVVEVNASAQDARMAATLANEAVRQYFFIRAQARRESAAQAGAWLGEKLKALRTEVEKREAEVEAYRASHGLFTAQGSMLTEQETSNIESALVQARGELAERRARHQQARRLLGRGGTGETTAGALNSEVMVQLRTRQADIARRMAEYEKTYGARHPLVQSALSERDDIARQISGEVNRLSDNLRDEAEIAQARVSELESYVARARERLGGNNAEQVQLRELERNANAARTIYENFLRRYHEVSEGAAGLGGDAQVVASATPPLATNSRPLAFIIGLAALLGLALGTLIAVLMDQLSTTLHSAEDVEAKVGAPVLTSAPHLERGQLMSLSQRHRHPAGFLAMRPFSAYAEALRLLRTRVSLGGAKIRIVAITSALPQEGKTTLALSLARISALSKQRVLLIDCDLRRRSLTELLRLTKAPGLLEVAKDITPLDAAVVVDGPSGAFVLPAAGDCLTSENIFATHGFRRALQEASAAYDLVILDCAPVLTLAEARDVAALADGVVVAARRDRTLASALVKAIEELEAVCANVLGVAFNDVDARASGRGAYADPLYFARSGDSYVDARKVDARHAFAPLQRNVSS